MQRSPTDFFWCDRETPIMKKPWSSRGCGVMGGRGEEGKLEEQATEENNTECKLMDLDLLYLL